MIFKIGGKDLFSIKQKRISLGVLFYFFFLKEGGG